MQFNADQWLRYSRQIQQGDIGINGQRKIIDAHVVIIGLGGLGCPAAQYLCAAGVGKFSLIDPDRVNVHNLHRQILYTDKDIGELKVEAAKNTLHKLNSDCELTTYPQALSKQHQDIIASADIVLDCTDQFSARYLLNYLCLITNTPWCFASVENFAAQTAIFLPQGPCYQCLYPYVSQTGETCNSAGILGSVPGTTGLYQSLLVIDYLCGRNINKATLFIHDFVSHSITKIRLAKEALCPACTDYTYAPPKTTANPSPLESIPTRDDIDQWHGILIDVRSEEEHDAFNIGGENIPLDQLAVASAAIQPERNILLYCQSGARSIEAARRLRNTHPHVAVLNEGILGFLSRKK